jgi:hypothetical protein
VDHSRYEELYGDGGDDTPTMGTLSCNRVVISFSNKVKYIMYICHDYFISHFTNRFNYAEELDAAPELEVLLPVRPGARFAQLP